MANIYTKRSHFPRTTSLSDYQPIIQDGVPLPKMCRRQPRLLSPDRSLNPHPKGLAFHSPEGKAPFSIWDKDFSETMKKMPNMLRHQRWVNFSAPFLSEVKEVQYERTRKLPEIKFTVDTIYRMAYQSPSRLPDLDDKHKTTRFGSTPAFVTTARRGIVPDAIPKPYPPYQPY